MDVTCYVIDRSSYKATSLLREHQARFMAAKRLRWRPKTFENYRVALDDYISVRGKLEAWQTRLDGFKYDQPWVFPALFYDHYQSRYHPARRPLTISGLYQMLQRRLSQAGLPHRRVHDLRHAHALHALQAGIPINQVQKQLGHSSVQVTQAYLDGWDADRRQSYMNFSEGDIDSA